MKTGRGETVRCEALRQDDPGHEEPRVLHHPPGARILFKTIFQVLQVYKNIEDIIPSITTFSGAGAIRTQRL